MLLCPPTPPDGQPAVENPSRLDWCEGCRAKQGTRCNYYQAERSEVVDKFCWAVNKKADAKQNPPESERYFLRCTDCLSVSVVVAEREPAGHVCGACGGRVESLGAVRQEHLWHPEFRVPCDARCTSSTGPNCNCTCKGENHGTNRIVEVQVDTGGVPTVTPKNIEQAKQWADEYRTAKGLVDAAIKTKYGRAMARKEAGEHIPDDEFYGIRWAYERFNKAKKLRSHKGRLKALADLVASLEKPETVENPLTRQEIGEIESLRDSFLEEIDDIDMSKPEEMRRHYYLRGKAEMAHDIAENYDGQRNLPAEMGKNIEKLENPPGQGPTGTCQNCFHKQRTHGGLLVLHGYHRPGHGYIIGRCTGTNFPPFEVSCEKTKEFIGLMQSYHDGRVEHVRKLKADEYETLPYKPYHARYDKTPPPPIIPIPRGAGWQGIPHAMDSIPSYEDLKATLIYNTEGEIRLVLSDIKTYQKAVDEWKPVPWPPAENPPEEAENPPKLPPILYHGTTMERLEKIRAEGLKVSRPELMGKYTSEVGFGDDIGNVSLAVKEKQAIMFAAMANDIYMVPGGLPAAQAIVRIDTSKLEASKTTFNDLFGKRNQEVKYWGNIPPEAIADVKIRTFTWQGAGEHRHFKIIHVVQDRRGEQIGDAVAENPPEQTGEAFATELAGKVAAAGGKLYIVGGFPRDKLMGFESKDMDIEVYGLPAPTLENILSQYGEVNLVGKQFGVYKVGENIDVSLPRRETKLGPGHKAFDVEPDPTMSLDDAVLRRDLTINALFYDPGTKEIIDVVGGKRDIETGVLRQVRSDTFVEDPLRVYRVMQFAARFGFAVDPELEKLCTEMCASGQLAELPQERVFEEFNKMLVKGAQPSLGLKFIWRIGATAKHFPELQAMIGTPQQPDWHAEGDVFTHTCMVLDAGVTNRSKLDNPLAFMYGCLCHDMGKPAVTKLMDGKIKSHEHDTVGVDIARTFMERLTDNALLIEQALYLVRNHQLIGNWHANKPIKKSTAVKLYKSLKAIGLTHEYISAITLADNFGRIVKGTGTPIEENLEQVKWFNELMTGLTITPDAVKRLDPLVTGYDLIDLGLKPGPRFKELLDACYTYQMDSETTDKATVMALVKGMVAQQNPPTVNTTKGETNMTEKASESKDEDESEDIEEPEDFCLGSFTMPVAEYFLDAKQNPPAKVEFTEKPMFGDDTSLMEMQIIVDGDAAGRIDYQENPHEIHPKLLMLSENRCGKGVGKQILEHLRNMADKKQKPIRINNYMGHDFSVIAPQRKFYTDAGYTVDCERITYTPTKVNPPAEAENPKTLHIDASTPGGGTRYEQWMGKHAPHAVTEKRKGLFYCAHCDEYLENVDAMVTVTDTVQSKPRDDEAEANPIASRDVLMDEFKKERAEHPSLSDEAIWQIVADHEKEQKAENPPRQKYYALEEEDGFSVGATFKRSASAAQLREAESWLDQYGSGMAREMGSVEEARASASGCHWDFKTAEQANAFGRRLNGVAPPGVVMWRGEKGNPPSATENPLEPKKMIAFGYVPPTLPPADENTVFIASDGSRVTQSVLHIKGKLAPKSGQWGSWHLTLVEDVTMTKHGSLLIKWKGRDTPQAMKHWTYLYLDKFRDIHELARFAGDRLRHNIFYNIDGREYNYLGWDIAKSRPVSVENPKRCQPPIDTVRSSMRVAILSAKDALEAARAEGVKDLTGAEQKLSQAMEASYSERFAEARALAIEAEKLAYDAIDIKSNPPPVCKLSPNPGLEVRKTGRYIRERQKDPKLFDKDTLRTKDGPRGHKFIVGRLKGKDTTEIQSILHPLSEEKKLEARKGEEVVHKE